MSVSRKKTWVIVFSMLFTQPSAERTLSRTLASG